MKLSEAMMLGSTTCKMVAGDLNSCALGAAANALGLVRYTRNSYSRLEAIKNSWPWLDGMSGFDYINEIVRRFDGAVCDGELTYEQLVDYVSSIEPSCGECNKFDCACTKNGDGVNDLSEAHEEVLACSAR